MIEGNNLDAEIMSRMQRLHGFGAYRLDDDSDDRRHMAPNGWDAYSTRGTMASLASLMRASWPAHERVWQRDELEEEMFSVRAMRHVWRVKPNATKAEWRVLLGPAGAYNASVHRAHGYRGIAHQWLLTTHEPLTEPVNSPRVRSLRKLKWRWPGLIEAAGKRNAT